MNEEFGRMDGSSTAGAKEQAREKLTQVKEKTTDQVESRLSQQKSRAAETLTGVSQSLLLSSQQLRDQQQDGVGRYMERAAEQVDRLAHFLDTRNVPDIVHEVEDLARRQPAVFLGGAVALGFLAARFLKSSQSAYRPDFARGERGTYRRYEEPSFAPRDSYRMADPTSMRTDHGL